MYKINCKQMINVMYHTSEDNKSRFKQQESTFIVVIIYYLLTESEVITGKSQTEALMY